MGDAAATGTQESTTTTTATQTETAKPVVSAFTAEQQAEINRLMGDARKEGRDVEAKRHTDAEAEAKRKRDQDAEVAKGEFEKVRGDLEAERDTHKATAETLQAEVTRWRELATKEIDAEIKELPASIKALDPGGDDLFARREWVAKAKKAALDLSGKLATGNGVNPPANGGKAPTLDQTKEEFARMMGLRARR